MPGVFRGDGALTLDSRLDFNPWPFLFAGVLGTEPLQQGRCQGGVPMISRQSTLAASVDDLCSTRFSVMGLGLRSTRRTRTG